MISNDLTNTIESLEGCYASDELTRSRFEKYLALLKGHACQVGELEQYAVPPAVRRDPAFDGDNVVQLFGGRE